MKGLILLSRHTDIYMAHRPLVLSVIHPTAPARAIDIYLTPGELADLLVAAHDGHSVARCEFVLDPRANIAQFPDDRHFDELPSRLKPYPEGTSETHIIRFNLLLEQRAVHSWEEYWEDYGDDPGTPFLESRP